MDFDKHFRHQRRRVSYYRYLDLAGHAARLFPTSGGHESRTLCPASLACSMLCRMLCEEDVSDTYHCSSSQGRMCLEYPGAVKHTCLSLSVPRMPYTRPIRRAQPPTLPVLRFGERPNRKRPGPFHGLSLLGFQLFPVYYRRQPEFSPSAFSAATTPP